MRRRDDISELQAVAVRLSAATSSAQQYLSSVVDQNDSSFDLSAEIPQLNESLADLFARILTVSGLVEAIDIDRVTDILPKNFVETNRVNAGNVIEALDAMRSHFASSIDPHGGVATFNYEAFQAATRNGQTVDLLPPLMTLNKRVEALLQSYHQLASVVGFGGAKSFKAASKSLSDTVSAIQADTDDARQLRNRLKDAVGRADELLGVIKSDQAEVTRLREQIASDRKTVNEYASESTEKLAAVRNASEEAAALQVQVNEYAEAFKEFQSSLDSKKDDHKRGKAAQKELLTRLDANIKSVDDTIAKSEAMLSSATVAGLAKHFYDLKQEIAAELRESRVTLYIAMGLLAVSALPLALYILLPILSAFFPVLVDAAAKFGPGAETHHWQQLAQLGGRIIILVPAAWFGSFAARRHASLFRLREHYAYKYSMAVSVEGFKKQAPEYASAIAATVLEELAFNPAERMDAKPQDGNSPAPALNYLLNKLRKSEEAVGA